MRLLILSLAVMNDIQRFRYIMDLRDKPVAMLRERLAEVEDAIARKHPVNPGDWYFERAMLQAVISMREKEAANGAQPDSTVKGLADANP